MPALAAGRAVAVMVRVTGPSDESVQAAPGALGVTIAMLWLVPIAIVAQLANATVAAEIKTTLR